ncbi:MAG: DNA replication and repair protein RecF [Verrucomicrobiota bacterium]|nr:DNA replication and repair protein RecF [Verrucomicrobiota bacterium]
MPSLKKLKLKNFRNIVGADLSFSQHNLLIGSNGQGKTSLLEAIYYLSILRSFKTPTLNNLINYNADYFSLTGRVVQKTGGDISLQANFGSDRKLLLNGITIRRSSDFIRNYICVVFAPDDIMLVNGSADIRRRFFDIYLSILYPVYLKALRDYKSILQRRNKLLKFGEDKIKSVQAFNEILALNGAIINEKRIKFIKNINKKLLLISDDFKMIPGKFYLNYQPSPNLQDEKVEEIKITLLQALKKKQDADFKYGYTSIGPHRDDFLINLGDIQLNRYGSRGQCRLASLVLKIAVAEIFKQDNMLDGRIVYLVDDVIGELDPKTKDYFFNFLSTEHQLFFASTEKVDIFSEEAKKTFHVSNGEIIN